MYCYPFERLYPVKEGKNNIANITYSVIEKTYPYKNGNKRCLLS